MQSAGYSYTLLGKRDSYQMSQTVRSACLTYGEGQEVEVLEQTAASL